jgi:hypothetical protein
MKLRSPILALFTLTAIASACALLGACDPVHQDQIAKLGGERAGVPKGPLHRPGQPCLVCHGGKGPGSPDFTVAGTIYRQRDSLTPAVGAQVLMTDAFGRSFTAITNQAGNFYLRSAQFDPAYPLSVKLCTGAGCDPLADPPTAMPMKTHIGREGSCAACHTDPEGRSSAGHIYLVDTTVKP